MSNGIGGANRFNYGHAQPLPPSTEPYSPPLVLPSPEEMPSEAPECGIECGGIDAWEQGDQFVPAPQPPTSGSF